MSNATYGDGAIVRTGGRLSVAPLRIPQERAPLLGHGGAIAPDDDVRERGRPGVGRLLLAGEAGARRRRSSGSLVVEGVERRCCSAVLAGLKEIPAVSAGGDVAGANLLGGEQLADLGSRHDPVSGRLLEIAEVDEDVETVEQ